MKKVLWALPILAVGIAIGGFTLPNVFASTSTQPDTPPAQAQQWMQQALNSPQGQEMIQECGSYMAQFNQSQK